MHSKIIQPGKQGKVTYDNKGSCNALVDYLGHEARENKVPVSFFNSTKEGILALEVKIALDHHVKGVRKEEVKFYSLVISPSHEELKHLTQQSNTSNSKAMDESLQLFSRQVMENYAANFNLKNDRKLSAADLQWYATIHYHRQYKGVHQQVKEGEAKAGTLKSGLNAHVHIIVSKRDLSQQITLNPQGKKERFEITGWQKENESSFDALFAYKRQVKQQAEKPLKLTGQQKERLHERISNKLSVINTMLSMQDQLPKNKVEEIARKKEYNHTFFFNLNRLEANLRKGQPVHEPLHLLEHNKDKKPKQFEGCKLAAGIEKAFKVLSTENMDMSEELSFKEVRSRFRKRPQSNRPGMGWGM